MSNFAWVTLATNDSYSLGALVVAYSLKRVHTAHQLAVLITPGVSESMRNKLRTVFNLVQEVNLLDSQDAGNLALLKRPELGVTFTKLHCWRLTQFEKCVFLDADTLVIQNCDELFEREELSAAPDVGWPDCFNSGVYVFKPNAETYANLIQFAVTNGSFDGGDQGLLNQFFSDWAHKDISKHLPFTYNTSSVATYSYIPAFKQYGENVKILHFIGAAKPWLQNFNSESKKVHVPGGFTHLAQFLQYWWDIFCEDVHSRLSPDMNKSRRNVIEVLPENVKNLLFENTNQEIQTFENTIFVDPWENYLEKIENGINNNHQNSFIDENHVCISEQNDWNHNDSCQNDVNIQSYSNELAQTVDSFANDHNLISAALPNNVEPVISNHVEEVVGESCNDTITEASGIAGALSKLTLGEPKTHQQEEYEEHMRRQYWESGNIDYMGKDSFENIWRRIQQTIGTVPKHESSAPQEAPKRHSKSRSRSSTPKRDMRDRSPTPQPEDVLPVEKKEVQIEPAIQEEEAQDDNANNMDKSPPLLHYDPTTNTTTLTKKVFAGYQQIITTKTPEGKTKTQTKTFYDPSVDVECKSDEDIEQLIEKTPVVNIEVKQERVVAAAVAAKPEPIVEKVQAAAPVSVRKPSPAPVRYEPKPVAAPPPPQLQLQEHESLAARLFRTFCTIL